MALKTTMWRPDTCGCEIALEWDDAVEDTARTHTLRTVTACPLHAPPPKWVGGRALDRAADVLAENQGKNRAIGALVEHAPDLKPTDVTWRFDAARKVVLSAPTLGARKAGAQAALTARFGAGVVTIE